MGNMRRGWALSSRLVTKTREVGLGLEPASRLGEV